MCSRMVLIILLAYSVDYNFVLCVITTKLIIPYLTIIYFHIET